VIWLSWRQHRSENLLIGILFTLLALLLVPTGLQIASAFDDGGLNVCAGSAAFVPGCGPVLSEFWSRFHTIEGLGNWLNLLPGLLGVLVAAPFVVDLESGTYRLAWTQSVPRGRWLVRRLVFIGVACIVTGTIVSVLYTWWRGPFDALGGRMKPNTFDLEGITPVAYTLFAAALVLAIGALTRRTAIAIASAFGLYVVVRLAVQFWVREHLVTPTSTVWSPGARKLPAALDGSWDLGTRPVDHLGHPIADPLSQVAPCIDKAAAAISGSCLRSHGVFNLSRYVPAENFWTLQALESGIFVALALVLTGSAVWAVLRRMT
jgi:hypothetical protein